MSEDLIRRSDAIKALRKLGHEVVVIDKVCSLGVAQEFIDAIRELPSADRPSAVDLSSVYSTAYKSGYEKGKADRPQGEWIDFKNGWKCNACEKWNSEKSNFCPNCGADMRKGVGV